MLTDKQKSEKEMRLDSALPLKSAAAASAFAAAADFFSSFSALSKVVAITSGPPLPVPLLYTLSRFGRITLGCTRARTVTEVDEGEEGEGLGLVASPNVSLPVSESDCVSFSLVRLKPRLERLHLRDLALGNVQLTPMSEFSSAGSMTAGESLGRES